MKPKKIRIDNLEIENNVFLAPLAGFTDYALRSICLSYGAGLAFNEMVSSIALVYKSEKTEELLRLRDEKIKCAQIFGNDPIIMRRSIEESVLNTFDIIDINFGCPMPKIFNNNEGSALLSQPSLAEEIVRECSKSGKIITCKMRTGIHEGDNLYLDFAKAVEQGGAKMLTVHGRVKDKIYSGEPDYDKIREVKENLRIPVIGNGGIFSKSDADKMISETGVDGIMIARCALEKPWIFSEILGNEVHTDKFELIKKHIEMLKEHADDREVAVTFRRQLCLYLKGERNSAQMRLNLLKLTDTTSLLEMLYEFFHGRCDDEFREDIGE